MNHRDLQRSFAAHLRDPQHNAPPPQIEDRRLAVYRELFFNNVASMLSSTFPVLEKILGRERWLRLARDFYAEHRARTPRFLEVPREFVEYLMQERGEREGDPPFLAELAHYEWVELALAIDAAEVPIAGVDPQGDLFDGRPVISPLAWTLAYRFPVQRLSPAFQPAEPPEQPTWLAVCRRRDDRVVFVALNALTARLLELIAEQEEKSGWELLTQIAKEVSHPQAGSFIDSGRRILDELRREEVLLGTRVDLSVQPRT